MGTIKTPIFPAKETILDKIFEDKFFKDLLRITKKVSFRKKKAIFSFIETYNKQYGTKFFVKYERIGESLTSELKEITCSNRPATVGKIKKTTKGDLIKDNQYLLFTIEPTKPSPVSAEKKDSWMLDHDHGDYPIGVRKTINVS